VPDVDDDRGIADLILAVRADPRHLLGRVDDALLAAGGCGAGEVRSAELVQRERA
jgi:hypothetical protein